VAPLGIAVLAFGHRVVPGMVGHPDSHPSDTVLYPVTGPDLIPRALRADPGLLDELTAAGEALIARGAGAVATNCGYFSVFQRPLASRLPVPVFCSPLLQLPSMLAALPDAKRVLLVAAAASGIDAACLAVVGVGGAATERVRVMGMDGPGHFREAILEHSAGVDADRLAEQIARKAAEVAAADPSVGAILLECGEMPLAAPLLGALSGLPVYDYSGYLRTAAAAVAHNCPD